MVQTNKITNEGDKLYQQAENFGELRIIDFGASTRFKDHNDENIELKDFTGTL